MAGSFTSRETSIGLALIVLLVVLLVLGAWKAFELIIDFLFIIAGAGDG